MKNILKTAGAFAASAALSLALTTPSTTARPDTFPERPIKFLLGFGAGGPTDIVARTLGDQLSRELGTRVVVENRPGASGNIATQALASADADGYTFLIAATPLAVNESMFPELPVKFGKDVVAVAPIGANTNVLVVLPSLNVKTVSELVQRAREQPDAVSYATVGIGSSSHLAGADLDLRAGTKMLPVSYRSGGEALKDLLGGRVDAWFAPISSVLGAVQTGQFVALATTGPQRDPALPLIPTMSEAGFPGFDMRLWVGVFARPDIPANAMGTIAEAIANVMASQEMKVALATQAVTPLTMTRAEFNTFVAQEIERWKTVVATFKK